MSFVKKVWDGDKVITVKNEVVIQALWSAAQELLREATERVPHDKGTLQDSGTGTASFSQDKLIVSEGEVKGGPSGKGVSAVGYKPEISVSYDTPYAARLHEHPEYTFKEGREGKWLENAMNERREDLVNYMKSKGLG